MDQTVRTLLQALQEQSATSVWQNAELVQQLATPQAQLLREMRAIVATGAATEVTRRHPLTPLLVKIERLLEPSERSEDLHSPLTLLPAGAIPGKVAENMQKHMQIANICVLLMF